MRKVVASAFVSLDGVMQAPGGPQEDPTGGFRFGGWTVPYWDDSVGAELGKLFAEPFDLLLGRKTYDIFAAHWPYVEQAASGSSFDEVNNTVARSFNHATKYVATRSPQTLEWRNSEWLGKDVVASVTRLKAGSGPMLLVQGSSQLLHTLLSHRLLDELWLLIFPLALGKGKRVFGADTSPAAYTLKNSSISTKGVLIAHYALAGEVTTGSFAMDEPTPAEIERRKNLQ